MAITQAQKEQRRGYIGSSDVACLVGVDPWRNIADLWLDKTGKLAGDQSSVAADIGTDLESAILSMFERRMNLTTERNIWLSRNEGFPACANLDGAIGQFNDEDNGREMRISAVVEAKSTSKQDEWGASLDAVPLRVLTQVHWQMWNAGCDVAYVPVLFPDFGRFRLEVYRVDRNADLLNELTYRAGRFWADYVLADIPPPAVMPHLETLKRLKREPQSIVQLDGEALAAWTLMEEAKKSRKDSDEIIETYYKQILLMLGQAEAGELPTGELLTYMEQNGQKSCDWTLLEMRLKEIGHPEIYAEMVKQGRHRVLRYRKAASK